MGEIEILDAQLPAPRPSLTDSPAAIYLAGLAPRSQETQAHALRAIVGLVSLGADPRTFPWHHLQYQHVVAIRSQLAGAYAPATVNRTLAALKGVMRECFRLDLISAEHLERIRQIKGVRGERGLKGRALTADELKRLFAVCPDTPAGVRDRAILAVLYSGGLRRAELVGLDVSDLDVQTGYLQVRAGKGNKDRMVPLADRALELLSRYVTHLHASAQKKTHSGSSEPLFVRVHRGAGQLSRGSRLSAQAVLYIIQRRCAEADVTPATPHDFRRTMISDQLDAGTDIVTVQALAGHANVTTTGRYDRRGERAKRAAAQRLQLP